MSEQFDHLQPETIEEIREVVANQVNDEIEQRGLVTTDQLDQLKEDVSERVSGLKERVSGFTDRILGKDEVATLAQEHASGTVSHIVGEDCKPHEPVRDDLRDFIREEMDRTKLAQDASEGDESDEEDSSTGREMAWGSN